MFYWLVLIVIFVSMIVSIKVRWMGLIACLVIEPFIKISSVYIRSISRGLPKFHNGIALALPNDVLFSYFSKLMLPNVELKVVNNYVDSAVSGVILIILFTHIGIVRLNRRDF